MDNQLNYSEISNLEFEDIDHNDMPDYCDAYISSAEYKGVKMTDEQLDEINEDKTYVYEQLMDYLH